MLLPGINEKQELWAARIAAGFAVSIAGLLGIYPPGFVAQVVAFAFGLAAASFFPAPLLGIFDKRTNAAGAITGMLAGLGFTAAYIVYFKLIAPPELNVPANWLFGISPEGIGVVGMLINFGLALSISRLTRHRRCTCSSWSIRFECRAGRGRRKRNIEFAAPPRSAIAGR